MENQIRIKSKDIYVIEVNDNGDTIEFDITDIELPFRIERAYKSCLEAQTWLKGMIKVAEKKEDRAAKGEMMTAREKAVLETYREYFKKIRSCIDEMCGNGASEKIFGKQNYVTMFNDFWDQMAPHFEKMKIRGEDIRKRIAEKYSSAESDEI